MDMQCGQFMNVFDDWQAKLYAEIRDMHRRYLQPLNQMRQELKHTLEQQGLNPVELEKLKILESLLERVIAFLNTKRSDISRADKSEIDKYAEGMPSFVNANTGGEPLSWLLIPHWLDRGEWPAVDPQRKYPYTNFKFVSDTPKQVNSHSNSEFGSIVVKNRLLEDRVKALEENQTRKNSEVENIMEKNQLLEDRVKALEENHIRKNSKEENIMEKNRLLEDRVKALEENQTHKNSEVENIMEKNRLLEDRVKALEDVMIQAH